MTKLIKRDAYLPKRINKFLEENLDYSSGEIFNVVENILRKKKNIKNLVSKYNTPFYVYDEDLLDESIEKFVTAFSKEIPSFKAYYALKINHSPLSRVSFVSFAFRKCDRGASNLAHGRIVRKAL